MDPAKVEAEVGFRPLTLPNLPVERMEVGHAQGAVVVRIVQMIAGRVHIELVEALRPVRFQESAGSDARVYSAVRRGDVWVALAAQDHANGLAATLEPMK